jgi:hypothetical protein
LSVDPKIGKTLAKLSLLWQIMNLKAEAGPGRAFSADRGE